MIPSPSSQQVAASAVLTEYINHPSLYNAVLTNKPFFKNNQTHEHYHQKIEILDPTYSSVFEGSDLADVNKFPNIHNVQFSIKTENTYVLASRAYLVIASATAYDKDDNILRKGGSGDDIKAEFKCGFTVQRCDSDDVIEELPPIFTWQIIVDFLKASVKFVAAGCPDQMVSPVNELPGLGIGVISYQFLKEYESLW